MKRLIPLIPLVCCGAILALALALGHTLHGCADSEDIEPSDAVQYTETRQRCLHRDRLRNLYWGDLHFHTHHSWDAYGYDLTVTPAESYAFAKGGAVKVPPLDSQGRGTRTIRLGRPLDFAAVTDHAEYLGEVHICRTPGAKGYDSQSCVDYRKKGVTAVTTWGMRLINPDGHSRDADTCGVDGQRCRDAAKQVWQSIQQAAEQAYDRSEQCAFVSLVGYEYTATPVVTNMHRNVIFRNDKVIEAPISYYEKPHAEDLWQELKRQCPDQGKGCDVMVIPHNMNWSNGIMFFPKTKGKSAQVQKEEATLRARMEPVLEVFQHKGDGECMNGLSGVEREEDPLCRFEKLRFPPVPDCGEGTGWGAVKDGGCVSRLDFLRGILLAGLEQGARLGLNPYQVGLIGSTDSHNGTPGYTSEEHFHGHVGNADDTIEERMGEGNMTHKGRINNPGGLAAVWAVERSRDAIFEALQRREVYATSGTRIALRFFGGWSYPDQLCEDAQLALTGYRKGVPMGSLLRQRPDDASAPRFVLQALADPGTAKSPGTALQRAQIIKGWIDGLGKRHEKIYEVAGNPNNNASVDPSTCKKSGMGAPHLCVVWQDPAFDPAQRAFYYARVVENPTCRWSTWQCISLPAAKRPKGCTDPNIEKVIQERAWSSPIWYEP